jgi:hypothetical protein
MMEFKWEKLSSGTIWWASDDREIQVFLDPVNLNGKKETVVVPDVHVSGDNDNYNHVKFATMQEAQAWVETMVITGAFE